MYGRGGEGGRQRPHYGCTSSAFPAGSKGRRKVSRGQAWGVQIRKLFPDPPAGNSLRNEDGSDWGNRAKNGRHHGRHAAAASAARPQNASSVSARVCALPSGPWLPAARLLAPSPSQLASRLRPRSCSAARGESEGRLQTFEDRGQDGETEPGGDQGGAGGGGKRRMQGLRSARSPEHQYYSWRFS